MARPRPKQQPPRDETPHVEFENNAHTMNALTPSSPPKGLTLESKSLVVQLQESQFQSRLTFAQRNPRNILRCMEAMVRMATITEEAAKSMSYAVPRAGKIVEGQSIRFAEVVKQAWLHGHSDAFVAEINRAEKYISVVGVYFDFETNTSKEESNQRSIKDKHGKIYTDDMINVTCNAACAIAERNAILKGIPRAAWMNAWMAARAKAAGGADGLQKRRQDALAHFMRAGVGPDRVLATLGVRSEAQLTSEHLTQLLGMWSALENGEETLDDLFPPIKTPAHAEAEKEAPPKQKKRTLHDLAEEAGEAEAERRADASEDPAAVAAQKARDELIDKAKDEGVKGFHKGLQAVPARFKDDPELAAAWTEGYDIAAAEAAQEESEEDEGEDFMNEGEGEGKEDRERYSR